MWSSSQNLKLLWRHRRRIGLLFGIVAGIVFWQCLPDPLFSAPVSQVLLDRNGELLAAHIAADEQWRFPELQEVPEKFQHAIVTFEDKRFNWHLGFDPVAFVRAIYLNTKHGRVVSGGSTLTMQVIRLVRGNPPRTWTEKLREIVMAIRLELTHSKREVLSLYANHAPFGGNVVGIEAAAWRYFARDARQLSWAEAATLAVLPNNPALIHPGRARDQLKAKRDSLLQRLQSSGYLSPSDLRLAMLEPLPESPKALPRMAPHLLDTLTRRYPGHARFNTTLDRHLQEKVEDIVHDHAQTLALQHIHNTAALVIDNTNFEVLAYVGNSAYRDDLEKGYAVDIIRRPRSTGSILKPLLYANMIQQGEILPKTLIPDLPTQFAGYMPENFDRDYRGAVSAQSALARSLNVPAVRMLRQHGVDRFYTFLKNASMSTLHRTADNYGLSLILGGAEGNLWDMGALYSNLAWIAKQPAPEGPLHYHKPKILVTDSTETTRVSDYGPAAAWLTLNALVEVARPGQDNYWKEFESSHMLAWKTGTSFGMRDAWAIGNDPHYTIAVWVGNASGEGRPEMTGVAVAAPVLFNIVNQLDASPAWFIKPLDQMKRVNVCKIDGYLAVEGCDAEEQWIPKESHFDRVSPYQQRVHLDSTGRWQVNSECEQVSKMQHKTWFVLPQGQAFYYQRLHPQYRPLPPFRADCQAKMAQQGNQGPIDLLYPLPNTRIYIPTDLAAQKSQTVFEAVHRQPNAILYWHIDDRYVGETETFHQLALNLPAGTHVLTLVDDQGNRLARRFEVLGKQ